MSPQVSRSAPQAADDVERHRGELSLQVVDESGRRHLSGVGKQMAIGVLTPFLECAQQQLLFAGAHALRAPQPSRPWRPPPDRRATQSAARRRAGPPSWGRRPAAAADRAVSAGSERRAPGEIAQVPVSQISRMRSDKSLPMPGHSRSRVASRPATGSGLLATMSAPLRYARILNGFSPLSSSRSAISPSTRAIATLSRAIAGQFPIAKLSMFNAARGVSNDEHRQLATLTRRPSVSILKVEQRRAARGERRRQRPLPVRAAPGRRGSRPRLRRTPWRRGRQPRARGR